MHIYTWIATFHMHPLSAIRTYIHTHMHSHLYTQARTQVHAHTNAQHERA